MPKRQTPAAPPSLLTREGTPSASQSAAPYPATAAAPAPAADGDDLDDLDLFPIYTTTNTGVSEIFLIDAPPTYRLRAHEEGGSTLFQLASSSQTDTADADIFPIYVSPSLRDASFFEQGDLDDLVGADGVDDLDLFPIEVSAGMSSETSALFALAQLGARGRPAASTPRFDIADDADSASHSPAEGSMLFRLSDLGQRPFVDDDPLADTETPADDDDLMPIYLPPGLSGPGARAQRSAPPAPASPAASPSASPPQATTQGPVAAPARYRQDAEAALDARLRQDPPPRASSQDAAQTRPVPTLIRTRPQPPSPASPPSDDPPRGRAVPSRLWDIDSNLLPLTMADTRPTPPLSAAAQRSPTKRSINRPRSVSAPFRLEPLYTTLTGHPGGHALDDGSHPNPGSWINALPPALIKIPRADLLQIIERLIASSAVPLDAPTDAASDDDTFSFQSAPKTNRWRHAEHLLLNWLSTRLDQSDAITEALLSLRDDLAQIT
jgi:hypothetical protein